MKFGWSAVRVSLRFGRSVADRVIAQRFPGDPGCIGGALSSGSKNEEGGRAMSWPPVEESGFVHQGSRQQLPDEAAGYVREQIMSGNFRPGDFLRMGPIAEAVGMSITPVREGLLALAAEGYVRAIPRRGFVVAEFTRRDIQDLFWTQAKLAGELAARAAREIRDEDLLELAAIQAGYDAAIAAKDVEEISREGHRFHRLVNRAAASERLARLLASTVNHLPRHFYASLESHAAMASTDHAILHGALKARDHERARRVMERHIEESADVVTGMLEARGLWGEKE